MATDREVQLPDIGEFDEVDVSEVLVKAGERVEVEESLIVLESDKATMEIPAPFAGVLKELKVGVGDKVGQGDVIAIIEVDEQSVSEESPPEPAEDPPTDGVSERYVEDSATPPPAYSTTQTDRSEKAEATDEAEDSSEVGEDEAAEVDADEESAVAVRERRPHASPLARRVARDLGVDLSLVPGTGRKGRVLKENVHDFVKGMIATETGAGVPVAGVRVARPMEVNFEAFGETEVVPLNRIRKLSAANLHRSWVTIPHVTQFDEADVTELEIFRKEQKTEAEARGTKLTFLPFVIKAVVRALEEFPQFNSSLDNNGENLILKRYFHIGVAVDTANGLVVPVVRDANRMGLFELAAELQGLSEKARGRKLRISDLQGGSFTISSLGGIGGTLFTPIVNHPEVAILGISRMRWMQVYQDGEFVARQILPLSLSYDHRVIDGADAARFTSRLALLLSDLRRLLL